MPIIFAILAGIIFGAGLTLSDMINPARVFNFLDIAGSWDPTLIFVMVGGLAIATLGYSLVFRRRSPLFSDKFNLPTARQIDLPLVGGSALFGVGWGLAGICPGPAIADLATLEPKVLLFIVDMLAGMILANALRDRYMQRKPHSISKFGRALSGCAMSVDGTSRHFAAPQNLSPIGPTTDKGRF